jgi:hypothetical protein
MGIISYIITYHNPYFYGSREYYNVKQTSFFYIPWNWNKISIFMFQEVLFIRILKQTYPIENYWGNVNKCHGALFKHLLTFPQ